MADTFEDLFRFIPKSTSATPRSLKKPLFKPGQFARNSSAVSSPHSVASAARHLRSESTGEEQRVRSMRLASAPSPATPWSRNTRQSLKPLSEVPAVTMTVPRATKRMTRQSVRPVDKLTDLQSNIQPHVHLIDAMNLLELSDSKRPLTRAAAAELQSLRKLRIRTDSNDVENASPGTGGLDSSASEYDSQSGDAFDPPSEEEESDLEDTGSSSDEEEESDDSFTQTKKVRRSKAVKSHVSRQTSRVAELSHAKLRSSKQQPCVVTSDRFDGFRQKLHASAVPSEIPCRAEEFEEIKRFILHNLSTQNSGTLYISGVPGTGKTLVTRQVVTRLQCERTAGGGRKKSTVEEFDFLEINGMKLTDPQHAFVEIYKKISGNQRKVAPATAMGRLQTYFGSNATKKHLVLLVDELDLLWTKKQQVLYQLFEWPSLPTARLTLLAIANTLDLPERAMIHRVSSRLGMVRLSFQPYTFQQLEEILQSRLAGLCADAEGIAVQLVARKVAAVSGDARRALELCRRAVELAATEKKPLTTSHISAAVSDMAAQHHVVATTALSRLQKAVLRAMAMEYRRTGVEDMTVQAVARNYEALAHQESMTSAVGVCGIIMICGELASRRLIVLSSCASAGIRRRLRLNIDPEDLTLALEADKKNQH